MEVSYSKFKSKDLKPLGRLCISILSTLRVVDTRERREDGEEWTECSNMTIINMALRLMGPTHEARLTAILLALQVSYQWAGIR